MPLKYVFSEKYKFCKNSESYLQSTVTKEFKNQIGSLAISASNPETSCSMRTSEKHKGVF